MKSEKHISAIWEPIETAAKLLLQRNRFGRITRIPLSEWPRYSFGQKVLDIINRGETDNSGMPAANLDSENNVVRFSHEWIAGLDEGAALELKMVPSTPLTLQLTSHLQPTHPDFRIDLKFIDRAGRPQKTETVGAFLKKGSYYSRLPDPLFLIHAHATALSKPIANMDKRLFCLCELTGLLNDTFSMSLSSDNFLEKLNFSYASALSLSLTNDEDKFDFDPVLFGRDVVEDEEAESIDELNDSLLTPAKHKAFLQNLYQSPTVHPGMKISSSHFLYFPEDIRKCLTTVKVVKSENPVVKKRFALNPRPFFRDKLDASDDAIDVDLIFIETDQFSKRVTGADVWEKAVTPWLQSQPNSWLPEKCGIKIGDVTVEMSPEQAVELHQSIVESIEQGVEATSFNEIEIPASQDALNALEKLIELSEAVKAQSDEEVDGEYVEGPTQVLKYFLLVKENLDDLEFTRSQNSSRSSIVEINPPPGLTSTLKSYQTSGLNWLANKQLSGHRGAILADDMGLGKTLQTLAGILWRKKSQLSTDYGHKPTLIVTPTALTENWSEEIVRHFLPNVFGSILKLSSKEVKNYRTGFAGIHTGDFALDVELLREASIIITTYEVLRDYHMSFAKLQCDIVVFDEIQQLKNPTTQKTRAAKTLNSDFMLGLTGTPVENSLDDLWSISDVVWPGILGSSKEFSGKYKNATSDQIAELREKIAPADALGKLPFLVRRMKSERLKELPKKNYISHEVAMPKKQADTFRAIVNQANMARSTGSVTPGLMLKTIQGLRSASLHPSPPPGHGTAQFDDAYVQESARLIATFRVLDEIRGQGEKALIFLEDRALQAWLSCYLKIKYGLENAVPIINGSIPGHQRQEIVNKFQNLPTGFGLLIVSPKAGGVGLTLTAANHVIHLTRWWNPAVEDQATDRVYRIGQDKDVSVHIPIALHPDEDLINVSFDRTLNNLLERKRALGEDLLAPTSLGYDPKNALFNSLFEHKSIELGPSKEISVPPEQLNGNDKPSSSKDVPHIKKVENVHTGTVAPSRGVDPLPTAIPRSRDKVPESKVIDRYANFPKILSAPGHQPRPNEEVFGFLNGVILKRVYVVDGYMGIPNNRELALGVLRNEVFARAGVPDVFTCWFFGPENANVRGQYQGETLRQTKHEIYQKLFSSDLKPKRFEPCCPRHKGHKDIHDREIYFQIEENGEIHSFNLGWGNGLEAWGKGHADFKKVIVEKVDNSIWNSL